MIILDLFSSELMYLLVFIFQIVGSIDWPHRESPPPDVPDCGFEDELCQGSEKVMLILLALSLVLLVLLLIGENLVNDTNHIFFGFLAGKCNVVHVSAKN